MAAKEATSMKKETTRSSLIAALNPANASSHSKTEVSKVGGVESISHIRFLWTNRRWLLATHAFVGVLGLSSGLYYICYCYYDILPIRPWFFVFKITSPELFPFWGFGLCLIPALTASVLTYWFMGIPNMIARVLAITLGHGVSLIVAFTFIPGSAVMIVGYFATGILTGATSCADILIGQSLPHYSPEGLKMRHERLSMFLSQLFWGMVFAVISGGALIISLLQLYFSNPGTTSGGRLTESFLWLIHDFGMILLSLAAYYALGLILWLAIPVYLELIRLEEMA